ncbi:hypothetical protein J3R82DRAFT_7872, partial [Butyriboletus roseoflavus]
MVRWWQDPGVEDRLAVLYVNMIYLLLGVYGWEYFQSFGVEYAIIRGRLAFRWVLVSYHIFVFSLSSMTRSEVPYMILVDIAIGTSSTNLMIRTWVIWKYSRLVHILLLLLALGQWTILVINATTVKSLTSNGVCVMYLTQPAAAAGAYVYSEPRYCLQSGVLFIRFASAMCYDLIVFVLSVVKLSKQPSDSLKERLRAQGLLYFAVVATANILPTVWTV